MVCYSAFNFVMSKNFVVWLRVKPLNLPPSLRFPWNKFSNQYFETYSDSPYLTHYQTTNFRLFQTERVCRRQFQIWWKWQKAIQTVRKHCGKRRNCSLRAISPFPTVFSKGLFPRASKGDIVWEWVKKCELGVDEIVSAWNMQSGNGSIQNW